MDAKHARNAAANGIKQLKANTKAVSAVLEALCLCTGEHHEAIAKLQAAAERIKPKPDRKATLGSNSECCKLLEKLRFSQIAAKYGALHKEVDTHLSARGQQRWMLNDLCSMLNICVEQHTGGKAGEAFESRRDTRLIHVALKGLRDGNLPLNKAEKGVSRLPRPWKPISETTSLSELSELAKDAQIANATAEEIRAAFSDFAAVFDDSSKVAAQGFDAAADGEAA